MRCPPYIFQDIVDAYEKVGVEPGRTVILNSDLSRLGAFENTDKIATLEAHYKALKYLLGPKGTLVTPAGNQSLCNTDRPFHLKDTPSSQMGLLAEYARKQQGVLRSFHPFVSFAAVGKNAEAVTQNVSRHAWGFETPTARLLELDTLCVSTGAHPRLTCSAIHHVEQVMGVPYRYTKEFLHPVFRGDKKAVEPFYTFVCYLDCDIKRNKNKKIFSRFSNESLVAESPLGRGSVFGYSLSDFFQSTTRMLRDNIYEWLDELPLQRPYSR